METFSEEAMEPTAQFKFDLRTLVTNLRALADTMGRGESVSEKIGECEEKLEKLDEIFENLKAGFSDDDLKIIAKLFNEVEELSKLLKQDNRSRSQEGDLDALLKLFRKVKTNLTLLELKRKKL